MDLHKTIKMGGAKKPSVTEEDTVSAVSVVCNTINAVSNLFYESVLVIDMRTMNLWYLSLASGLSKRLASFNLQNRSFPYLVETLSGVTYVELKVYLEAIMAHYIQTTEEARKGLVYMTDMPMLLNEGTAWTTYRFSPLFEDEQGNMRLCVVAISFATGHLYKRVMAISQYNGNREIYDPKTSQWNEWKTPELTPIEINVLALSAQGLSVIEISKALDKAVDTIKSARKRIFRKFKVENIVQAIICALNNKII